jgi:hypothetical protein
VLPSGLIGGLIFLEGFVGILLIYEPRLDQEKEERVTTKKWFRCRLELHGIE